MRGRQTRDGQPAAAHLLRAKAQARLLPLAQNRSGTFGRGPKASPSCDWTEQGPAPQDDSVDYVNSYLYGNVSGRVTSLALDLTHDPTANTLYVGAAYGGLWKTTNALSGSPSYSFIGDPNQSLAVGAIALDSSVNPPVIYVGTGELNMSGDSYYGVGILNSVNGGTTWGLASTANSGAISFQGLACSRILVDPTGPATVLAAMGFACCHAGLTNLNQGLYRSTDHGATWNQVSTVNGGGQAITGHSFTDVLYDGSATFYAAVRFQGIYYSTDHGASWTQLPSPFPSGTAPNNPNFGRATLASRGATLWCLVADDGTSGPSTPGAGDTGLSQSVDGGHTWTAVSLPSGVFGASNMQGTYDQYVAAPSGSTELLVAGEDLFRASSPNGNSTSWTNLTNVYGGGNVHTDQHAIAFANSVTWFLGNDGGVWDSLNTGGIFKNLNTNLGTIQFYSASPDPSAAGKFLGGSQDNGTAVNHGNSGLTWAQLYGGDGGYTDASPTVLGQFYTENFFVSLRRSDNYGGDFFNNTVIDSSYGPISGDNSAVLTPYEVLPQSPVSVILGTSRVWEGPGQASNGTGWSTISAYLDNGNTGDILALAAAPSNTSYVYAATTDNNATPAYHVFTNHSGPTWTNITGTLPTANPIQGLAVDPTNPQIAYVGVQGFVGASGSGHLFKTTNGGGSWTDITGNLPDAPVNSIVVDPLYPTDLYVANDVGVFATQSVNGASTSWARLGTTLPDSTVLQIKMAPTCPRALLAATHGRGAWTICPLSVNCTPPSPQQGTILSAQAQPNLTNGQTPVRFLVNLGQSAQINLSIYDVAGELVYSTSLQGSAGVNTVFWPVQLQDGSPPASGVYIYAVQAGGDKKTGQVEVLH